MNILLFAWLIALFLWSIFFKFTFFLIFILIIVIYYLFTVWKTRHLNTSLKNKLFASAWGETGNPTTFVTLEVDCEIVDKFIEDQNVKNPANPLSYTIIAV